jgi:flagellar biosynthesis/type III secretory pathway protein FliH
MALAAAAGTEHRYQLCKDEYCDRFPCRVYKEGYQNGYEGGYGAGVAAGYASGFEDGIASCPGPHGGE